MSSRKRTQDVLAKRQSCPTNDPSCRSSTPSTSGSASVTVLTVSTSLTSPAASARPTTSAQPSSTASTNNATSGSSSSNAGTIAGSVVGGVVFLVALLLAIVLFLRARKRRRTPPSSEFMNAIKDGAAPVLRLDSGAEYTPALPEKGGHNYPPAVPLPFLQNSYYPSPPMQSMRFPDEMMMTDIPSQRPSVEKPLCPLRLSSQQGHDSFGTSTSIGSKRELWGSETEIASVQPSPVRQSSPRADSVLQFAPRYSLDESSSQVKHLSQSPTSLHPLRRQPD